MPLKSKLFGGDPKLEACLMSDPAHILPGAMGDHVGKIQQALTVLGLAMIDLVDASAKRYGPSTASGVLRYKRLRNIVNHAYQSQPDNIVGKMTIATLDREVAEFENRVVPPPVPDPTSEPLSNHFSIRMAARSNWIPRSEPPDGSNAQIINPGDQFGIQYCFQVFDELNKRCGLFELMGREPFPLMGPEQFMRSPRHFFTPWPFPLSGLNGRGEYWTDVTHDGDSLTMKSRLELTLRGVTVAWIPMFIHDVTWNVSAKPPRMLGLGTRGNFQFVKFGLSPHMNDQNRPEQLNRLREIPQQHILERLPRAASK
jgi:hypothetical protein